MPNRQLRKDELDTLFYPLLERVRSELCELAGGDEDLLWALRRKLYKELIYGERGKPNHRRHLKSRKRKAQENRCARCSEELPLRGAVLDRIEAMLGYTPENTRLLCHTCDREVQAERGFA